MQFRFYLRYYLIRTLHCSHAEADAFCRNGAVEIDGIRETNPRRILGNHEEICLNGNVLRKGTRLRHVLFYKPNLYECTTNREIENNIYEVIPEEFQDLFPLGRLDKNSEGLLLLTNDGQAYKELMDREAEVEKEYRVHTFHPVTEALAKAFREPFRLGQRYTLPARFEQEGEFCFRVVLKEGINRQIRRICAKNENQVKQLIRIRIGDFHLGNLQSGECQEVEGFR
jgi:23S rRNA pseudouridine2604 synthase